MDVLSQFHSQSAMKTEDFDPAVVLGCAVFLVSIFAIWIFFRCIDDGEQNSITNGTYGKTFVDILDRQANHRLIIFRKRPIRNRQSSSILSRIS